MVAADIERQITRFLYKEAYLLDHRQYNEWLDLLTDDLTYNMPIRVTVDNSAPSNLNHDMMNTEETKEGLRTKINRLNSKSAWVENPAPRQRHFISNIVVETTENLNEYKVYSYFLFKRSRNSDEKTEEIFGEREDIIRNEDGNWKIASRHIYPDQSVLTVMNLSMFL